MDKCPRCGEPTVDPKGVMNGISRRDNTTQICNSCSTDEAFFDYYLPKLAEMVPKKAKSIAAQERLWLTLGMPFNEIMGKPYEPLVRLKASGE